MNIPRMRLGGTLEQRDATLLLTLSAFMITARIPFGFYLLGLGPLVVIVVQGLRRRAGLAARPLWHLLAAMAICSLLSGVLLHTGVVSSFTTAVVLSLVAAAALLTGRPRQGLDRLFDGIYIGLLFHWVLSLGEAVSGIKLLPILYPSANTTTEVDSHRFYVTSMFPNYNDYSVAMAILVAIMVTKVFFRNRVHPLVKFARLVVLAYAAFEITYMGSRGALLAMVVMVVLVVVHSVRELHPRAMGVRTAFLASLLLLAGGLGLFLSPWVQDHSTAQRGVIAGNIFEMMLHSPLDALFGWASLATYQADAASRFGGVLMDPHNLLLEIIVWFGIPALAFWLVCWWIALRRGFIARRTPRDWRAVAATVVLVTYPVLGVVCSSTLRYYIVWLFTIVAVGRLALPARAALGIPVVEQREHPVPQPVDA